VDALDAEGRDAADFTCGAISTGYSHLARNAWPDHDGQQFLVCLHSQEYLEKDGAINVLNYRLLPREEWDRAKELLLSFGQQLPEQGLLSVAENGEIRAILCFHPVMHCEPIWIDEAYRGKVNPVRLHEVLLGELPKGFEYYAFTPSRKIRWIAGSFGMKPMPWDVWKGTV